MILVRDIVVVGGGPVGAAAALALRAAGFDVALVERAVPTPYDMNDYDLRVYAISPQSAAVLEQIGAWQSIAAKRSSAYSTMHVWEDGVAHGLSFNAGDVGLPQLGWIIEHGLIVAELWSRFGDLPVHRSADILAAEFGEGESKLRLADGNTLTAKLVVAADGADSKLRGFAGIDTVGWQYPQRAIVCHVRTEKPHRAIACQRFLKSGPLALLPLADGRSSIVWSAEEPLATELLALDDAAFRARLGEAGEHVFGEILETTRRVAFPLRLLHASDYVRPGLVLIGDAAHTVHPLAGQGVNLGFGDVGALVAVLIEAREAGRSWFASRTLARYQRARKADNVEMLAMTDALYRAHRLAVPGMRALLGLGLDAMDRLGPLKGWFARKAVGTKTGP